MLPKVLSNFLVTNRKSNITSLRFIFVVFSNYEETDSRGWLVALLMCTGIMYCVSLAAVVLMYLYYTGEHVGQCKLHEFFISINLIICIVLGVVSTLPKIQEHMPKSGLLQVFFSTDLTLNSA